METFRYLEKYKLYLSAEEKRNVELSQLFGIIEELLSVTSKERVVAHADYPACLATRDGSALWNIVYSTHQTVNMYHTPAQQTEAANRNYFNLHQPAGMTLDAYYERFNETVKGLVEAGITKPNKQDLAVRFLAGLNRVLFQELHHQLNNLPHFNIAYPADLPVAYHLACELYSSFSTRDGRNGEECIRHFQVAQEEEETFQSSFSLYTSFLFSSWNSCVWWCLSTRAPSSQPPNQVNPNYGV
jgi:hypothetical protein